MSHPRHPRFAAEDLRRLSTAILDVYQEPDPGSFPETVVGTVAGLLKSDICAYNEIDHAGDQFRPVHDYPGAEPARYYPMFVEHERDFAVGPHVARTGETGAVKHTDFYSQAQFERTGLYNEFFRQFRVRRLLVGYTRTDWGCQVCISAHRERRDFSERDRALLTCLLPHIRRASDHLVSIEPEEPGAEAGSRDGEGSEASPVEAPAFGTLGPDLAVVDLPDRLARVFKRWFPRWDSRTARLPEPVLCGLVPRAVTDPATVIETVRRPWTLGRPGESLTLELWPAEGGQWRLHFRHRRRTDPRRCTPGAGPVPEREKEVGGAGGGGRSGGGMPAALTDREREVLHWLCEGKRNAEIGVIVGASANTVRKHVQHILAKLGAETRSAAVRMALESEQVRRATP